MGIFLPKQKASMFFKNQYYLNNIIIKTCKQNGSNTICWVLFKILVLKNEKISNESIIKIK